MERVGKVRTGGGNVGGADEIVLQAAKLPQHAFVIVAWQGPCAHADR